MRIIGVGALAGAAAALALSAAGLQAQDRPFRSMAVGDGRETLCEIPKVPVEYARTIGEDDGYKYWLEKLELERRLETGECECQVDAITWDEVGEFAEPWIADRSTHPIAKRREILAEIEALQAQVQAECAG